MTLVVSVAILAITLTVAFANPSFSRALRWSAIWGLIYSYWIVAPAFLEAHHLHIDGPGTFLVVAGLFATAGGLLGVTLAGVSLLPWGMVTLWSKQEPASTSVVTLPGAVIPVCYIALGSVVEYMKFGRWVSVERSEGQVQLSLALLVLAMLTVLAHTNVAKRPGFVAAIRKLSVAALVISAALLPIRDGRIRPADVKAEPLVKKQNGPLTPLVIIALDGVGWNVAEPLMSKGELPWLESIVAKGQRGTLAARWPPHWSGPAWASIVTGYSRAETGVSGDLLASAPGVPEFELPLQLDLRLNPLFVVELELLRMGVIRALPMPRQHLRRSPLWERVGGAGGRVGVVRLPFTYPATDQSITVVSNLTALDLWDFAVAGGIERGMLVTPASQSSDVLALFTRPSATSGTAMRQILPNPTWKHSPGDVNRLWVLERLVDFNEKTFDAAEHVLATDGPFDLFMFYVPGTDSVSHAFWKYRSPDYFPNSPPDSQNVATLGAVIDRYLHYVDSRIQLILTSMPNANVLVVSDHGQSASPKHEIWSAWHSGDGIFAAAGPDVPTSLVVRQVDYQDVVPWALELMGYEIPADLPRPVGSLRTAPRGH